MPGQDTAQALIQLDAITRRLRRECPWDREQDERTIVPHTVEEAYELADAAYQRDDGRLLDELGDALFQVHFLSLLLEERGQGDLAQVAGHAADKLVRRHPHVFGETEVADAEEVLANWDEIKRTEPGREPGLFGEVPENLPGLLHARKLQRRVASSGFDVPGPDGPLDAAAAGLAALRRASGQAARFDQLGDLLFAVVNVARKLELDPELALRAASGRFRDRVTAAARLAASQGGSWDDLPPEQQLDFYGSVKK